MQTQDTPLTPDTFKLNQFGYNTTHPPTVRHAALLNAVQLFSPEHVHAKLTKMKKAQKDETSNAFLILKKDQSWVKRMFMGDDGIDVSVTVDRRKKHTTTKKQSTTTTTTTTKKNNTPVKKKPSLTNTTYKKNKPILKKKIIKKPNNTKKNKNT
jgi:hypothetical protein